MKRLLGVLLCLTACTGAGMATWFSETFAAGPPLRDPVGTGSTHVWWWYNSAHTSQYPKLIQARDSTTPIEVGASNGKDGTPGLYTTNTTVGASRYATFAISGTAASRNLTDAGTHIVEFDVQFIGANDEWLDVYLLSSVAMYYHDLAVHIGPFGANLIAEVEYTVPNGTNFGITETWSSDYTIGTKGSWRTGGLWHHVKLEGKPGTVTTWTPGTFVDENNYTGGTLEVASDGWVKLYLDDVEVLSITNLPLILNYEGQSADESSPGSWVAASRGVEANLNRVSLLDVDIRNGSAVVDNLVVRSPVSSWVNIANYVEMEVDSAKFEGGHARVRTKLWTRDSGPTVQARLYNVGDDVSVGESEVVTSTTPSEVTFPVTLTEGRKFYTLQVTSDTPGADLFAIGPGLF